MNHRFHDPEWVQNYARTVNERCSERLEMFPHVSSHLIGLADGAPVVVELAGGPGILGKVLLESHPGLSYVDFNYSEPFLEVPRDTLAPYNRRVELHQTDLNEDDWPSRLDPPVHAVVSNMAIHDMGSEAAVTSTYRKTIQLLEPDSLLINTGLVTKPDDNEPPSNGKLKVTRRIELLTALGPTDVRSTLDFGHYACIIRRKSA